MSDANFCKHCSPISSHIKTKLIQPVKTVKHGDVITVYTQHDTSRKSSNNISEGFTDVSSSSQTMISVLGYVPEWTVQAFITGKEQEEVSFNLMQRRKSLPKGSENLQFLLNEFRKNSKEGEKDVISVNDLNGQKPRKEKNDLYVSCKRFPLVCTNRKVGLHHCVHNH
ncbi:hypothetical protein CHS0354_011330 [Potamilus streckersoni]|uniref:Uncharacterized protein n=1 Tax=Potamilus streckersoni TaxID=2493646 RepID=A0AAE0TFK2_9BIVA|nr:hypothetical protein CHS0354_011330 [Potamilus streckersoni]